MDHVCSKCNNAFEVSRANRSPLAWGLGLRGIYTTNYGRALDHFNIVVCPACKHTELDDRVKVFGLFTPTQFKVVIIVAAVVATLIALSDLFAKPERQGT